MAIDTANKRRSMLGLALASLIVMPVPNGGIDAADRQHMLGAYAGIPFASAPVAPPPTSRQMTDDMALQSVAKRTAPALFCEMLFDSGPLRLWTGLGPVQWNGSEWLGSGDLGQVNPVVESSKNETVGMSFRLTGIPQDKLSLALAEPYQGRVVRLYLGMLDSIGNVIPDPVLMFAGLLDVMQINEGAETAEITVTAESIFADFETPRVRRYTPEDQAIDYPGDTIFSRIAALQDAEVVWGKDVE